MKAVRAVGIVIVLLAIVAAIVPPLYNCGAQGGMMAAAASTPVPKCHWTGQASIATAIPLGVLGLLLAFARRKETQRSLAVGIAVLGGMLILLPTVLIGTCAGYDMVCNLVLRPTMLGIGILTIVLASVAFALTMRPERETLE